jgi:hypothetical protein
MVQQGDRLITVVTYFEIVLVHSQEVAAQLDEHVLALWPQEEFIEIKKWRNSRSWNTAKNRLPHS